MFTAGGVAGLMLALGAGGAIIAAVAVRGRWRRFAPLVAAGALVFQVVHVIEHGLQVAVWAGEPGARPWISPWAAETATGVGHWCSILAPASSPNPLGTELLHLYGNVIFLAGLVVLVGLPHLADHRLARIAMLIQVVHVAEHVVLSGTLVATGTAHGLSTHLDQVLPIGASTTRVLFHFGINAVATAYAVLAVRRAGWRPWSSALRPALATT
ncbi:MAG: DUF6008 family protein [Actinomycetota bacterium]